MTEMADYFAEGAEIAAFESMEECVDKVHYYLAHEKESAQIARAPWGMSVVVSALLQ